MQVNVTPKMSASEVHIGHFGISQTYTDPVVSVDKNRSLKERVFAGLIYPVGGVDCFGWRREFPRGAKLKTNDPDNFAVREIHDRRAVAGIALDRARREREITRKLQSLR
jgi:hypothetical protein